MKIGGTQDQVPTLRQMLDLVKGKVPLVIELKGDPGNDAGLVKAVAENLLPTRAMLRSCPSIII